jgi:hypothetical protein
VDDGYLLELGEEEQATAGWWLGEGIHSHLRRKSAPKMGHPGFCGTLPHLWDTPFMDLSTAVLTVRLSVASVEMTLGLGRGRMAGRQMRVAVGELAVGTV